jgi:ubiquinone/menaquinone biosynthesis C-methylase UbiE
MKAHGGGCSLSLRNRGDRLMTDTTTGTFDDGAGYERLMGRWSRLAGRDFLAWLNVPAGLSWLDVGCGNGAFTEEVITHAKPAAITGIDPSPGQIAFARSRGNNASFVEGDALALPFADAQFDVAAMALVIAFVTDPAKAVAEMQRVVRPGGTVATYMWDLPNAGVHLAPFYRALKDMGLAGPMPPSAQVSRSEALEALWRGAGLKDVEVTTINITVHFTDFEDFWTSNTVPQGPQAERLKQMNADQIAELQKRLRATVPFASDSSISYRAFANAVKGHKLT